jgi:hypothetical protein
MAATAVRERNKLHLRTARQMQRGKSARTQIVIIGMCANEHNFKFIHASK